MTQTEKAAFTAKVFTAFITDRSARLDRGYRLRALMHEAIQAGKQPSGYRPDWIAASAKRVIAELSKMAEEFDKTHLDDKASAHDLLDIIATAQQALKARAG